MIMTIRFAMQASAALALINSAPVWHLDGEAILRSVLDIVCKNKKEMLAPTHGVQRSNSGRVVGDIFGRKVGRRRTLRTAVLNVGSGLMAIVVGQALLRVVWR
jgi:Zn-dependent protease